MGQLAYRRTSNCLDLFMVHWTSNFRGVTQMRRGKALLRQLVKFLPHQLRVAAGPGNSHRAIFNDLCTRSRPLNLKFGRFAPTQFQSSSPPSKSICTTAHSPRQKPAPNQSPNRRVPGQHGSDHHGVQQCESVLTVSVGSKRRWGGGCDGPTPSTAEVVGEHRFLCGVV